MIIKKKKRELLQFQRQRFVGSLNIVNLAKFIKKNFYIFAMI